jgi:hypothetical protein
VRVFRRALRRAYKALLLPCAALMPPAAPLLPPGVDSAAWASLHEAVRKQPAPRAAGWRTHARLASALDECKTSEALVVAHDCLVLPWFCGSTGTWRNLPRAAGVPDCVKRFGCAPSLAAFLAYETTLSLKQRHFYECLRERTPMRYWLDLDLNNADALQAQLGVDRAQTCRDALACMLERHIIDAIVGLFMVERTELQLLLIDGNGDAAVSNRLSLHAIVHGALLPDNEGAAAAVRLAVIDRLKARGSDGSDATAAALLRCVQVEAVVDRVNTKNRLRRLTGHTKIGQERHSKPLTCCDPLPPGAYFVSGAAAGGRERLLSWRAYAIRAPPTVAAAPLAPRVPAGSNTAVQPQVAAAIEAECLAIDLVRASLVACAAVCRTHIAAPQLHGAPVDRVLPPSAKFPCWTAFTTCRACPWRAHDSPDAGRAAGPVHRSARLYVTFYRGRVELGCTAPRHVQRASRPYARAASQSALFPDATDLAAQMAAQMEISPLREEAPQVAQQQENVSPFLLEHIDDIFTPRFAAAGQQPWRLDADGRS